MMSEQDDKIPVALTEYLLMWNALDMDVMRSHLDEAVSAEVLWVDPQNAHSGRDALEANVRKFRATYPNAVLALGSNVDGHNNRYRYEWTIKIDGKLLIRGFDVTKLDDVGLIERVDGFFGVLKRHE